MPNARWRSVGRPVVQLVIAMVVVVFLVRGVDQAGRQLAERDGQWPTASWAHLVGAGGLYLVGLVPMAWYWHRLLAAIGIPSPWRTSLTAYYVGHLGKYVPGKALVVVLRVGLLRATGGGRVALAVSVISETMTMMSVGGVLAAVMLLPELAHRTDLIGLALGLALLASIPTWPPVLRRLVAWTRPTGLPAHETARLLQPLTWRFLALGWGANVVGWTFLGTSLAVVCHGLGSGERSGGLEVTPLALSHLPLVLATCALAVVAGFLSLLPGGLGVREWVIVQVLGTVFGPALAIMAAVLWRLVCLMAELAAAVVLLAIDRLVAWGHPLAAPGENRP